MKPYLLLGDYGTNGVRLESQAATTLEEAIDMATKATTPNKNTWDLPTIHIYHLGGDGQVTHLQSIAPTTADYGLAPVEATRFWA